MASIMRAAKQCTHFFAFGAFGSVYLIRFDLHGSALRKQYLYITTAVLCAQCLDLSNLDNPRGTDSHIIGHAFSEPPRLIRGQGVGGCMQNRLIPSPLSDCGRARKSRREMGGQVAGAPVLGV